VLGERHPGAIEGAIAEVPGRARRYLAPSIEAARALLEARHPRAWEALRG
jgi:hypothetical protein